MGIVNPRPAIRARENRLIEKRLADYDRQHSYHVYDKDGEHHGDFATLDEARGCVAYDSLRDYQIIYGDWTIVEQGGSC